MRDVEVHNGSAPSPPLESDGGAPTSLTGSPPRRRRPNDTEHQRRVAWGKEWGARISTGYAELVKRSQ